VPGRLLSGVNCVVSERNQTRKSLTYFFRETAAAENQGDDSQSNGDTSNFRSTSVRVLFGLALGGSSGKLNIGEVILAKGLASFTLDLDIDFIVALADSNLLNQGQLVADQLIEEVIASFGSVFDTKGVGDNEIRIQNVVVSRKFRAASSAFR
jgi:hypothetical protein